MEVVYNDYNTMMYTMIGRATNFVALVDPESTNREDSTAQQETKEFEIEFEKNTEDLKARLKKEIEIIESLTGEKVKTKVVQPKKKEKESEEQAPEDIKPAETGELVLQDNLQPGQEVKEDQIIVGATLTPSEEKEQSEKEEESTLDTDKSEESEEEDAAADNETSDDTSKDTRTNEEEPVISSINVGDYPTILKVGHPTHRNLKPAYLSKDDVIDIAGNGN